VDKSGSGEISRRDFLKLSASGVLGLMLSELNVDAALAKENLPKIVNGVEVYGLESSVRNKEEMLQLIEKLDKKFLKENDPWEVEVTLFNYDELRDRLLPQKKRFLTVYVKESVYRNYYYKQGKDSPDYATWIKLHTDLTNRIFENGAIKTEMRMGLRRIVVVADDFAEGLMERYPMDTDFVWFEEEDYREKKQRDGEPDYMWNFTEQPDGSILFDGARWQLGNYGDPVLTKTVQSDTFNILKKGRIDCGLVHEWGHLGYNKPDTYPFDVKAEVGLGKSFRFNTWYDHKPMGDEYTTMIVNENIEVVKNGVGRGTGSRNIRGYYSDPLGLGRTDSEKGMYFFGFVPKNVEFRIDGMSGFEIGESWYKKQVGNIFDYYQNKYFVSGYKDETVRNTVRFDKATEQFGVRQMGDNEKNYPMTYVIRTKYQGEELALFFPRALLNMSYMGGLKDRVTFDIKVDTVSDKGKIQGDVQILDFVKKQDFSGFCFDKTMKNESILAHLDLPGTDLVCVWSYVSQ